MYLLVLLLPLSSALLSGLFGRFLGWKGSAFLSLSSLSATALLSFLLFYEVVLSGSPVYLELWRWLDSDAFSVHFGLLFDSLTVLMLVAVSCVSALVHLYSVSYLQEDPHVPRFLSYLSFFTFLMIVLVTSDNFVQFFIGWEGVGLCSYLLVSFWFTRVEANKAALKALLLNRVADVGFLLGVFLLFLGGGSLGFVGLLVLPAHSSLVCCLLFVGAVGKSAQVGLHSWLPDAMEGPTPVSALIHAATMVTAGVFLLLRSSSLFEASPPALIVVTLFGALTAFFGATAGVVQNDLKKIVAFSTCSQLGYMVLSCGLSQFSLSLFHLVNHSFFKALLFLAAGALIHTLQDEQDLRKMGGFLRALPLTYASVLVGSLSLAGFPFLAGFYSKDLILEAAYGTFYVLFSFWLALLAALLTAFYSARLLLSVFLARSNAVRLTQVVESDWKVALPLFLLSCGSIFSGYLASEVALSSTFPPVVPLWVKLAPLVFLALGACLPFFLPHTRPRGLISLALFSFFSSSWHFNHAFNHLLVASLLRFGHSVSYRVLDRGILEVFGPTGLSSLLPRLSLLVSGLQSGFLLHYVLIFLVFAAFFSLGTLAQSVGRRLCRPEV